MTGRVDGRPARGRPPLRYPLLLLTVALGGILAPLNSTMITVALPELRRDFDIGHAEIGWLVSAYLIAMAVAQPLGGRLGDQLGRARVFRLGLAAFLAFSLAAAFSPTFPVLMALRTGQALVGAAIMPNGIAMLRESVSPDRLGRSNGLIGSALSFSAAVGPLLGAGLLAAGSWRLLFLMNAPVVLVALFCLTLLAYPEAAERPRFALDWAGAAAFGALLVSLTVVLNSLGGGAIGAAAGVAGLLVFGAVFVHRQNTSPTPIVEWRLFLNRSYAGATAYILLANLVMYTTLLTVPFFIEEVQGKGSGTTGTLLGAMSILMAVLSPVGGRLSDALGRRLPALAGGGFMLLGVTLLLGGIDAGSPYLFLAACLAVLGIGMGLSFGAAQTAAVEAAPRELAGAAAGANSMMRYLGSITGVGILGAVLTADGGAPGIELFRVIFGVLAGMSVLAVLASLFIHRYVGGEEMPEPAPAGPARVGVETASRR